MCAFGSSTPRAPRGRQFRIRWPAGASCATCGRMLIPHSRMRYGSESAARRAGVQRSRARRPPGARGRRVFAASRRDFFPFRFRRPARLGGSRTQISGPLGPVRFHVSGSLFSGFGTQGCPWPCCMRRCYQDSLSMHHGTLSRLPGVACARSSGEVSRSPHTSLTTRQSRGVRRGTAREDVSQPSLLTLPQTATLTPSMGTVSSVAARLLCGRGDQIERLHGPFQRRLQVFVPILLKCGAKDGEDGGLPLSVCCGYRPNHGRACSLS